MHQQLSAAAGAGVCGVWLVHVVKCLLGRRGVMVRLVFRLHETEMHYPKYT